MKLKPARGYIFVVPVDEIPVEKQKAGFDGSNSKVKTEQPYKFRVTGVGSPRPFEGVMIDAEVKVGDIVSHNASNLILRDQRETTGFLEDGVWYLPMDFRDILGTWES